MYGNNLVMVYERLDDLGLTESERAFARWIEAGPDLVRHHRRSGGRGRVRPTVAARLRRRLVALAALLPPGLRGEVGEVVAGMDAATAVARALVQ